MALKPGRTARIAAAILAALVSLVCVRLGFWQLDRLEQRRELNASVLRAAGHAPVELGEELIDSVALHPASFVFRAVRVSGVFEPPPLLIRGRSLDGRPGVHLIVPFRLDGGELILVNQGWLPSPDGATVDPRPYLLADSQSLEGIVQALGESGDDVRRGEVSLPGYPVPSYLRLDLGTAARELGRVGGTRRQLEDDRQRLLPELPIPLPPPTLDEGSHLGYAIQWFSFAAIAFAGTLALVVRRSG